MSIFCSYGGFCPQFKYKIGETFGKTTHKLLTDGTVASSGDLVLAQIRANSAPIPESDPRSDLLKSRTHSWGDQKLMEQMIPGYTGWLYRMQMYRSTTKARTSLYFHQFSSHIKQEKVKHIITCFTKALLHVFKCICTGFCTCLTTIF